MQQTERQTDRGGGHFWVTLPIIYHQSGTKCNHREHSESAYLRQRQVHLTPWTLVASITWSGIRFWISGLIRSRVSARSDHFQHVVSSFPCRCPSFCRVCEKSLVTMRNGNKSPIILYSAMLRKCKTDPESVSRTRSPSKANRFFPMVGPIITLIFNKIRLITFGVILLTDTPTNTQTVSITQPPQLPSQT